MMNRTTQTRLAGADYFACLRVSDGYQVLCLWLMTAGMLLFRQVDAGLEALRLLLGCATICIVGFEFYSFLRDERLIWRARTLVLVSMYGYVLLNPLMGSLEDYKATPHGIYTAMSAVFLYLTTALSVYAFAGPLTRGWISRFQPLSVEMTNRTALNILLICFIPTLLMRFFLQDWSKVSSVMSGLFGLESQPWRHSGFGDWKAVLQPIGWLYNLVPLISGICWVRFRRWPAGRWVLLSVWLFVLPSLMFQRSRYMLIVTVMTVFIMVILSEHDRAARKRLYVLFVLLIPLLTILANLILIDRGSGMVMQQVIRDEGVGSFDLNADPRTVVEDNLYYFANTADVVPRVVPYRSPFELYFYMAINPIPRFLWPSKPWMSQAYLGKIRPYYAAVTIVGDLYIYGGWWHVWLGAMVFGLTLRFVDEYGKAEDPPSPGRLILYISMLLLLFTSVRALWNVVVMSYSTILLGMGLWLIGRMNKRAPIRRSA